MPKEKFNRKEQKYFISTEIYNKLMTELKQDIEPDKYFEQKICNIYFDTVNNDLVIHSISKPEFKEKIRLRSYEVPNLDDKVFLEIKRKYKKIVNKRRVSITYKEALEYISKDKIPNTNKQIMNEIDYYFKTYKLLPKFNITYTRKSFVAKEDKDLRITFDNNLKSSIRKLEFDGLENEKNLFEDGYIMEIKSLNGLPIWLRNALSKFKIYPKSFSKVGEVYKSLKEEQAYV